MRLSGLRSGGSGQLVVHGKSAKLLTQFEKCIPAFPGARHAEPLLCKRNGFLSMLVVP